MKVVKINRNTPSKVLDAVLNTKNTNKSASKAAKKTMHRAISRDYPEALCTLERNAQFMDPEEYINARTYLSSIEFDRLCHADLK